MNWIEDVQRYREEGEWIFIVEKFALAVFRILRFKNKDINWLANEMNISSSELKELLNGNKEVTLKTLIKIQNILGEDIITIINMK